MIEIPTVAVTILISVLSLCFSVFFGLSSRGKSNREDIEAEAYRDATVNAKLDAVVKGNADIKYDLNSMKKDQQDFNSRLIKVEQSTSSAHHRIDRLDEVTGHSTK